MTTDTSLDSLVTAMRSLRDARRTGVFKTVALPWWRWRLTRGGIKRAEQVEMTLLECLADRSQFPAGVGMTWKQPAIDRLTSDEGVR